jgi:hypothetical protein
MNESIDNKIEEKKRKKAEYDKLYREKNKIKLQNRYKEYKEKNKIKKQEYMKKYYIDRKDLIKEKNLIYKEKNKEKILDWQSNYRKNLSEDEKNEMKLYNAEYAKKNSEKLKENNANYAKINHEKIKQYKKKYNALRLKNNLIKTTENLRHRLYLSIKQSCKSKDFKTGKIDNLIGCTIEQLKTHLESQFKEGMNWELYGNKRDENGNLIGFHIDHIIPCSSFNLEIEEERKKCFHYTNLQPLWALENMSKGTKTMEKFLKEKDGKNVS